MANVKRCESCRKNAAIRAQVCGPARLCAHQAAIAGQAYCSACAEAKGACVECGEPHEDDPPNIVRGID